MPDPKIAGEFTAKQWELIAEALDSHVYWQLAPEDRRESGYVMEPHTEEEQETMALEESVRALLPAREETKTDA